MSESGTEFIFSPTYDMSRIGNVFIVAKMGYTNQYIILQGKKIVLWPRFRTESKTSDLLIDTQNFILNEISLENVERQYLDILFVYGVTYDLSELTDRIYEVHDIGRIYELISTLAKTDYFRYEMMKHIHSVFQNNQQKFIDYISDDEDRLLNIVNLCLTSYYKENKIFHEMFEKGTIAIPETVFSRKQSLTTSDTFENVLSCYLSQTLGIPILDLNKNNCCRETNRIATLYKDKLESKWFRCWIHLISYGLDVDMKYTVGTYLTSVPKEKYTTALMWIKETPTYNQCVCVKIFIDDRRLWNPLYFSSNDIKYLQEMFLHLTLSEHMDEIIDLAYDIMFHSNSVDVALFSYEHIWKIYYVVEFYFRKHRQNYSEQELIRQRCMYIEPGPTDDPNTINVTIDLSEQNRFIHILDKSPGSTYTLLCLGRLCIRLMINNSVIVIDNNETLGESTVKAIRSALRDSISQSVKNLLLVVAIHYREVELIKTLLIHGANPTASHHYAINLAMNATSEIAGLILDHSSEAYNLSPEIVEKLLLENSVDEPLTVKIDLLLRYGIDWKLILKKYILEVFDNDVLHPVLHDYYISSGITLSSFLLYECMDYFEYYENKTAYEKVVSHIVRWDLRFFPDTTINDLITLKHLDTIQQQFLYEYYNILLSEGLDPRHSDDYIWREACTKTFLTWIEVCLNGDKYTDPCYAKRSETLGENDNWAIKTYLRIGRGVLLTHIDRLYVILEKNIDTLDIDTMTEISRIVTHCLSDQKLGPTILLGNRKYIESIYDVMDRYKEIHPTFSFEKHTSILFE